MGSLFSLTLFVFFLAPVQIEAQSIKLSASSLDLLIQNYTFRSYEKHFKTGKLHAVYLPRNFSGVRIDTARFRCGSLRRYGAQIKEFHLGSGVIVQPCIERVMLVRQKLDLNWSSIYYSSYNLSGYKLISPVLGLLAYNAGSDVNFSNPFEVHILAGEKPITINLKNITRASERSKLWKPLCASFEQNGKVKLSKTASDHRCVTRKHGHFGLVIKSPPASEKRREKARVSGWKVAVGSIVGAALGASLLALLVVAMLVKVKKKTRLEELQRRAYEEEALRVSMVGHVRAPIANGSRTLPVIEHEYSPFPS